MSKNACQHCIEQFPVTIFISGNTFDKVHSIDICSKASHAVNLCCTWASSYWSHKSFWWFQTGSCMSAGPTDQAGNKCDDSLHPGSHATMGMPITEWLGWTRSRGSSRLNADSRFWYAYCMWLAKHSPIARINLFSRPNYACWRRALRNDFDFSWTLLIWGDEQIVWGELAYSCAHGTGRMQSSWWPAAVQHIGLVGYVGIWVSVSWP